METLLFIIGATITSTCLAVQIHVPTPVRLIDSDAELELGHFENITAPTCTANTTGLDLYLSRNGVINPWRKWRKFNVHPDIRYNQHELNAIRKAMRTLQLVIPCVEFAIWPQRSNPTGDYVRINKGTGCSSAVGRLGGRQYMTLESPYCMSSGIIIHEMMHALGILHEHQRSDRDAYVTIIRENIIRGHEIDFDREPGYSPYNIPYNVRSIMHYASNAHSWNGKPTMVAKNRQRFGTTGELQRTDIQKLQAIYRCK